MDNRHESRPNVARQGGRQASRPVHLFLRFSGSAFVTTRHARGERERERERETEGARRGVAARARGCKRHPHTPCPAKEDGPAKACSAHTRWAGDRRRRTRLQRLVEIKREVKHPAHARDRGRVPWTRKALPRAHAQHGVTTHTTPARGPAQRGCQRLWSSRTGTPLHPRPRAKEDGPAKACSAHTQRAGDAVQTYTNPAPG